MSFIAVVTSTEAGNSKRPFGDFSAFVDETKDAAIAHAINARKAWQENGKSIYRILVGELTEEVTIPIKYSLTPLTWRAANPQLKPEVSA